MSKLGDMVRLERRLGSRHPENLLLERAFESGQLVTQILRENPSIDLSTVRIRYTDGVVTVSGRSLT